MTGKHPPLLVCTLTKTTACDIIFGVALPQMAHGPCTAAGGKALNGAL